MHSDSLPGCAENTVHTVVVNRFHVFIYRVNLGVFQVTLGPILGDFGIPVDEFFWFLEVPGIGGNLMIFEGGPKSRQPGLGKVKCLFGGGTVPPYTVDRSTVNCRLYHCTPYTVPPDSKI